MLLCACFSLLFQARARRVQPGLSAWGGRGDVIKLIKKETGTPCVLGWFCAACDVQHAPLACSRHCLGLLESAGC